MKVNLASAIKKWIQNIESTFFCIIIILFYLRNYFEAKKSGTDFVMGASPTTIKISSILIEV